MVRDKDVPQQFVREAGGFQEIFLKSIFTAVSRRVLFRLNVLLVLPNYVFEFFSAFMLGVNAERFERVGN